GSQAEALAPGHLDEQRDIVELDGMGFHEYSGWAGQSLPAGRAPAPSSRTEMKKHDRFFCKIRRGGYVDNTHIPYTGALVFTHHIIRTDRRSRPPASRHSA